MSEKSEFFAEQLKTLRERKGLSQYALAQRTGLSKQAMSLLEKGESEPTWKTVQLLSAALCVDCKVFVDPSLMLPYLEPSKPRGRPRKASVEANGDQPKNTTKKRKKIPGS